MKKSVQAKVPAEANRSDYVQWLSELKLRYRNQQLKASVIVNQAMLEFYWSMGRDISDRQFENHYGSGFYKRLSGDLLRELPEAKGFSPTNLKYCRYFYDSYSPLFINRQQPVDDLRPEDLFLIPWGHHVQIINRCGDNPKKASFYVRKCHELSWSRSVLMNFLDTGLYEREGKAVTNFLSLDTGYREKELKTALIDNITKFLLELGSGFAYMGKEYRLKVGETEQFLDLLFYNINLRCYVVIEVKTGEFTPGDHGQLGPYVVAVNHILKKPDENPTLGLLICKSKDNVLAKYALESSNVPIGVSEYELAKLYPADFKSTLPSIEEIERELNRRTEP